MKKNLYIVICTLLSLLGSSVVYAADQHTISYSVSPVLPENQNKETRDFFDLTIEAGKSQKIEILVKNNTSEEIEVKLTPLTGITNNNGIIDYTSYEKRFDSTLEIPFSTIAKAEKSVEKIAPESEVAIPVMIDLPNKKFDGIILGGVKIEEVTDEDTASEMVVNKYNYLLPVKIRQNDKKVALDLLLKEIKVGQERGKNKIDGTIQNPAPEILRNLTFKATITKKENNEVIYTTETSEMKMAPNSSFEYHMMFDDQKFVAGIYELKIDAKADDFQKILTDTFEIKEEQAKELNKTLVQEEKPFNWQLFLFVFMLLVIILLLIILIIIMNRKKK